jgi:hypothetical protein
MLPTRSTTNIFSCLSLFYHAAADTVKSIGETLHCGTILKVSGYLILGSGLALAQTYCEQEAKGVDVEDYYAKEVSRQVFTGLQAAQVALMLWYVKSFLNLSNEYNHPTEHASVKKVMSACIAVNTANSFINSSLLTPLSAGNAPYIVGKALADGIVSGAGMTIGGYLLQKLNFNILPLEGTYFCAGTLLVCLHELVDFILDQMIQHDKVEMDALLSPPTTLALHLYTILLLSLFTGASLLGLKKYSESLSPDESQARNRVLKWGTGLFCGVIFIGKAMTLPINQRNASYVFLASLNTGALSGFTAAANQFVLGKLLAEFRRVNQIPPGEHMRTIRTLFTLSSPATEGTPRTALLTDDALAEEPAHVAKI